MIMKAQINSDRTRGSVIQKANILSIEKLNRKSKSIGNS